MWRCSRCRKRFTATSGTKFHSRKKPIQTYLEAIAHWVNAVKGVSALELRFRLRVSYKTAFVLEHKLREIMGLQVQAFQQLEGEVEIDGTAFTKFERKSNRTVERSDRRFEDYIPIALNQLRTTWDPGGEYAGCLFKRKPQTFPDVPFRREIARGSETLFGIGSCSPASTYQLFISSFRFYINRDFCHPADLCAVYPWALSSGVSGTPRLFRPLVLGARKAARFREEYWIGKAVSPEWREIQRPTRPFLFHPSREDRFNDSSPRDSGNNMGRIARSGVWDAEIDRLMREERISGIPLLAWLAFLSAFRERTTMDEAMRSIRTIAARYGATPQSEAAETIKIIAESLMRLSDQLE
jgi:hypothetical protein